MTAYAELAVTTNFSFLRGASHAEELVARAKELGLAGLGVADINSVAGVVRAHDAAKEHGVRLAVGTRLVFADGTPDILAYPRDRAAWGRLTRLLTLGKRRAEKGRCTLSFGDLLDHVEGQSLIVMERPSLSTNPAPPSPPPLAGEGQGGGRHPHRVSSSPLPNPPPQAGEGERRRGISSLLARLREAAPRAVWLAASMRYRGDDARRLARRAALAGEARLPLIGVGDVLYHAPERRPLQDVMTCVREHVTLATAGRRLEANAERHLKSSGEMTRLFRAAPQAVAETLRFLERCRFCLDELSYEYPDETRAGFATPQEALAAFAEAGARQRYPAGVPLKVRRALDHELALIAELDYAPYFLTVHDIVRHAREKNILCQGRGSAANSAVCFCLGITEVDPERSDLLFERFVSAERREPPDIDVDFEHERREEVIQYIYQRYGRERASLAATVISYRARSAIREVGKAFGLSDDTVGALAGTLWGWSVEGVSEQHARRVGYDPRDPTLARVLALAHELIGFPRHLSQHVGGFVITRGRLDEVVPIENAAMDDRTVVEWDKDDLDSLKILKIDVLALGMLTCLRRGLELMEKHYGENVRLASSPQPAPSPQRGEGWGEGAPAVQSNTTPFRPHLIRREDHAPNSLRHPLTPALSPTGRGRRDAVPVLPPLTLSLIPPEEEAVYRMLSRADSIGVFQVESRAQMSMLPRLRPKEFYDLVIEVAIVRPGPIQGDMVHPYLRRRQQLEEVHYPSPSPQHGPADELRQVLGKTLGVPLFQEQAMRIAIVAAGFTPSEADRLRRAMATFRRVGTISYFRGKLIEGMAARGYPRDFAERCFRQIEGFGEYGFPESHAASFALLVYASAWMKCRYPDVFAAALLNSQPMGFYAPAQIVRDAQEHGVEVREIDVNHSDWDSTLEPAPPSPPPLAGEGQGGGMAAGAEFVSAPSPTLPRKRGREQAEPPRLHPRHAAMASDIRATHALRLGLRQIKGFAEADARAIETARSAGFDSIRDLWLRTSLAPAALEKLALADAFRSLGLDRRQALWAVRALRRSGDKDDLPLFARVTTPELEPDVALPPMLLGEHTVEDYRWLHLSLKAHPVSFLRAELDRRGILASERLASLPSSRRVTVAGLVLVRQRPGSANGVIFMTLEDEGAIANTIVWPQVFEQYRPIVLGARLVAVTGKLQNEQGVIHVVAERLEDLTPLLRRLADDGGEVDALVRCDEIKRPILEWRLPPRSVKALSALLADEPQPADTSNVGAVMPKGRNFH
ncbi:OB-fold nucleic acid binding domain-containing protein [Xanthobacteraceae bacterium Astr-EGSB]|uniref:helix-hairpin-helix domain-containing protein n=1 Tax=Astrobacterium formosum TaxID=3069710 RepID=UPI0027B5922B|nr:OB-fold nucleic acid binding domain-containing protein [Xanthobacteraceae bacterium Astr-EGSB]